MAMKAPIPLLALFLSLFVQLLPLASAQATPETKTEPWVDDPASYVNAFIGTVNVGHVFPGRSDVN